jgi:hypothetical protein
VSQISAHSRHLAEEAARRGWQYSATGADLQLPSRWKWSIRLDHPFSHHGHGTGLDRRTPVRDVLSGPTLAGHPFWAFWFPYTAGHQHGTFVTRGVAFIHADTPLPAASALRRGSLGTRPVMSALTERAARRADQWAVTQAQARSLARQFGWAVGSGEFRRCYLVKAEDRQAAEWLAGPATQQLLLARPAPAISLTTNGADILAWSDYGGSHISRVEDYDIAVVDAMLAVLDSVGVAR